SEQSAVPRRWIGRSGVMVRMVGSGPERGRRTASRHFARVGYPRTAAARRRPYGVRPSRASLKLVVDQLALEGAVLDRPPVADPVLHLGAVPGLERGLACLLHGGRQPQTAEPAG